MVDGKYEHQGVDLHPIYALMKEHLFVRRSSIAGGGNFARALVEAGWRPPGPKPIWEVSADTMLAALVELGRPSTRNAILQKATGITTPGGRRMDGWILEFEKLIQSGRIVPSDPDAGYVKWVPAESSSQ